MGACRGGRTVTLVVMGYCGGRGVPCHGHPAEGHHSGVHGKVLDLRAIKKKAFQPHGKWKQRTTYVRPSLTPLCC